MYDLLIRFWNWLCMTCFFMVRFMIASAIMALFTCVVANYILWEVDLFTLPYWWYWCMYNVVFGLVGLFFRKGAFDDDD